MTSQVLSLAHDDFDGVVSCALAGCPFPRRWADYPDLPRVLMGFQGRLYAAEVNDLELYQGLEEATLYDHHNSVHAVLGLEPGVPVAARWLRRQGKWVVLAVGDEPAASMVSGLRQLGFEVPEWLARAGDVLDNFALAETREEWMMVAGYLASVRERWWKESILSARSPGEAAERARAAIRRFIEEGGRVDWGMVERLEAEAEERAINGVVPVVVVPEELEGLGRLAALRLEKRYPYVVLLRRRSDGVTRGTIVSLTHGDAAEIARALGGGGRRLWPRGSIGGFSAPEPPEQLLEKIREALARDKRGQRQGPTL